MTDKEKIETIKDEIECRIDTDCYNDNPREELESLLELIDSMQEEPQVEESAKTQHIKEMCKENGDSLTQEPVNKDFEMALAEMIDKAQKCVVEPWVVAAQWKDELIKLAKSEEPVSEQNLSNVGRTGKNWKEAVSGDDENALNSVAITFLQEQQIVPNFYADIIMKAVKRGANWQKSKDAKLIINAKDDGYRLGLATMKQQMMAEAVDGTLLGGHLIRQEGITHPLHSGDKVKLIVIKED